MARLMAAARFSRTPREFALLSPGEQTLCMDADRVMREIEHRRLVSALAEAMGGAMGGAVGGTSPLGCIHDRGAV